MDALDDPSYDPRALGTDRSWTFRPNASLLSYLIMTRPHFAITLNTPFSLRFIVTAIHSIFLTAQLYDPNNRVMFIADDEAAEHFGIHAGTRHDVLHALLRQLVPSTCPFCPSRLQSTGISENTYAGFCQLPIPAHAADLLTISDIPPLPLHVRDRYATFRPGSTLRTFLNSIDDSSHHVVSFSLYALHQKIVEYIYDHRTALLDERNPGSIVLRGDPLERALDVSSFHGRQLVGLG